MNFEGFKRFDKDDYRQLGEESLWPIAAALSFLVNLQFEKKGLFEKSSWRADAEEAYNQKRVEVLTWVTKKDIVLYGFSGDYGDPLKESEFYWINPSNEREPAVKEYGVFVRKNNFISAMLMHVKEVEADELNKILCGEYKKEKVQKVTDKDIVQAVARTLWLIYPDMTQAQMIEHKAIQIYAGASQIKRDNTLREWLKEVDRRDPNNKPGARKKKT